MKLTKMLLEELVREAVKKKFSKQQHKVRQYVNKHKQDIGEDVWKLARRSIYKDPSGKSALEIVKKALAQKKGQPAQQQPQQPAPQQQQQPAQQQQKQAVKPGAPQQPAAPQRPPEKKHAPAVQKQQSRQDAIEKASGIKKDPEANPKADPEAEKRKQLNLDRMAQILSSRRRRKLYNDPQLKKNKALLKKLDSTAKDTVLKMLMKFTKSGWNVKTGFRGLSPQQQQVFIKIVGWNPNKK